MPYGNELFLGFSGDDIAPAVQALGLTLEWDGDPYLQPDDVRAAIDEKLDAAYRQTLGMFDFFSEVKREDSVSRGVGYYIVTTPLGKRTMSPWELELAYDPHECGDEPQDAVFGVSLISRYFPTYLDWKEPHGGSGNTIYLDGINMLMIDQARAFIVHAMPNFSAARICIKTKFY